MPSTMIHLLIAYKIEPTAPDFFWIGNFAPDHTDDRELKRKIHLREAKDRWVALEELFTKINFNDPFERGWFLHLFTDTCWDNKELLDYKNHFEAINKEDNWYLGYRRELKLVSDYLYNTLPWAKEILGVIESADLTKINTALPITLGENEYYRDKVVRKRKESIPNSIPRFYKNEIIENFADKTISKYLKWIADHT